MLLVSIAAVLLIGQHTKPDEVDIVVLEVPKVAQLPVRFIEPKVQLQKPQGREVFGISPKSVTSRQGEDVKAGNTVAKAPDQEILKPGDPDLLPVPSEEYLVTSMPELKSDVRIPYPPESRKRGIQGAVIMNLLIDESGKVRETTLVEGPHPELNTAAMEAAKGFQFTPAMIQKKPVAVRIRYIYRFILER
jgi:protein TonB